MSAVLSKDSMKSWCRVIIQAGARSCTAQALTKLTEIYCRTTYEQLLGRRSASGQKPSDDAWYTKSTTNVFVSTLFMKLYEATAISISHDSIAFIHAYATFKRMHPAFANVLTPERADYLRKRRVGSQLLNSPNTAHYMYTCVSCNTPFLDKPKINAKYCPICSK